VFEAMEPDFWTLLGSPGKPLSDDIGSDVKAATHLKKDGITSDEAVDGNEPEPSATEQQVVSFLGERERDRDFIINSNHNQLSNHDSM